jgi:outer membrane protein OmpA-like peptidoglycan-associated protein
MKLILLVLGLFLCVAGFSQSFVGYGYDNYAGVNNILLNPGMLAGSKYKVNVNLVSVSALAGNNAYELDSKRLFTLHFSDLNEGNGYYKSANTDFKYAYVNLDVLGPSATINLNPKTGIGLITRMRVMGNESNLSNGLFQLLGNGNSGFNNIDIQDRSLQNKMHAFAEAGVAIGRVLIKDPRHTFKVGVTAKYISGMAIATLSSGQMLVNIDPANNINKLDADMTAQYSSNLDNIRNGNFSDALNRQAGHGWGLDLGFVYEWTPESLVNDPVPYRLRMGVSLTDIGSVNYTNSPNGQTYTMTADGHNVSELQFQGSETYSQYFTRLQTNGLVVAKGITAPKLNVTLPTAVHINTDWHVYKRFFLDGDILVNMVSATNLISPDYVTTVTMTPRMEKKWISIYSPISYNVESQLTWGAGVRIGPLFVGSGTVLSSLLRNRIQTADVHIGITVPIFQLAKQQKQKSTDKDLAKTDTVYKNITHDRDGDGVVDEKDECPDSAGSIALIGCPDKDGDGVPNIKDKCPDVPGSPKYQGCPIPDADGDGINDEEDACPLVKGVASNHGCPPIKKAVIQKVDKAADRIFFVRAKDIIEKNSLPELDRVVEILQSDPTLRMHIEGHTDTEGTDQRNQNLSDRRARAVRHYLETKGISVKRMDYKGYGSKRPMATNATLEGMAQNRRVEMHLSNWEPNNK